MSDVFLRYHIEETIYAGEGRDVTPYQKLSPPDLEGIWTNKPFALSYGLFISDQDIYIEPDCKAWGIKDGRTIVIDAQSEPWIARDFGTRFFAFMASNIREIAQDLLRKMIVGSNGETYTFALCEYGAVLVAEMATAVAYRHGDASTVGLLAPPLESNHARLQAQNNLVSCARAILMHDLQRHRDLPVLTLQKA